MSEVDICYICRDESPPLIKCPQCTAHVHIECAATGLTKSMTIERGSSVTNPDIQCYNNHSLSYANLYTVQIASKLTARWPNSHVIRPLAPALAIWALFAFFYVILGRGLFIYGCLVSPIGLMGAIVSYHVKKKSFFQSPFPLEMLLLSVCTFIPIQTSPRDVYFIIAAILYAVLLNLIIIALHTQPLLLFPFFTSFFVTPEYLVLCTGIVCIYRTLRTLFHIRYITDKNIQTIGNSDRMYHLDTNSPMSSAQSIT